VLNCSDATAAEIDHEVMQMLSDAYEEAKRMLSENREILDRIAAFLIEKETITGKEFMDILHKTQAELAGEQPGSGDSVENTAEKTEEPVKGPVEDTTEYPKFDV
jgi:cell division protease FtsH